MVLGRKFKISVFKFGEQDGDRRGVLELVQVDSVWSRLVLGDLHERESPVGAHMPCSAVPSIPKQTVRSGVGRMESKRCILAPAPA